MYKDDLALNNLQWLICYKTQPNPTKPVRVQPMDKIDLFKNYLYLIGLIYIQ